MKKVSVFLLVFALFWTAIVGAFDYMIVTQIAGQLAAENFPGVMGEITHSEMTMSRGSKGGTTYGVDIRYRYEAGDRVHEGKRYRTQDWKSSDSAWARKALKAYPAGSRRMVYYNPQKPEESVLSRGLDGGDLMLALFLTPFNVVGIGLWAAVLFGFFSPGNSAEAGGVKIFHEGFRIAARLSRWVPLTSGLATTGLVAFLLIFVAGIPYGFHPPLEFAEAMLGLAYGGGFLVFLWQGWQICSGAADLVIDSGTRTVELPQTFGRKEKVRTSFDAISKVTVESVASQSRKGRVSYTYAPTLYLHGGKDSGEKLAEWSDADKARAFVNWLAQKLGLPGGP